MTTPEALARLAEILRMRGEATSGPWGIPYPHGLGDLVFLPDGGEVICKGRGGMNRHNAAFIASTHDLASIAEHLRDEVARMNEWAESYQAVLATSRERERKLAEELAAARKALEWYADAERYGSDMMWKSPDGILYDNGWRAREVLAAVDAARKGGGT